MQKNGDSSEVKSKKFRDSPCPPWNITLTSFRNEINADRQHYILELVYQGEPISHKIRFKGKILPAGTMIGRRFSFTFLREKIMSEVLSLDGYILGLNNKKNFLNLPKEVRNLIVIRIMGKKKKGFMRPSF